MPSLANLMVFAASALVLLVIPGPAVLYITTRSASQGSRAGFVSVLGVHTGTVVHVVAAAVGLSALLVASAVAFSAVKLVGAAYLVFLGVRTIVGRRGLEHKTGSPPSRALRRLYMDGVVVNVLNPKTALFFLAFLPQFVEPGRGPVWAQTLLLGLVFMVIGVMSDSTYALLAAGAGRWLNRRRNPEPGNRAAGRPWRAGNRGPRSRYVEGGILLGLGVTTLAVPHRRPAA